MSEVELLLRIGWFAAMPFVWWFAVPVVFRWYRSDFDIVMSRVMAGFLGMGLAVFWPIAVVVYLIARLVMWRTRDEVDE